MSGLVNVLARHCRTLAVLAVVSVLIPAWVLPGLSVDNSIDVWLEPNSDEYAVYERFLERFGSEEFVVIGATVEDPFGPKSLEVQVKLANRLRQIEGVAEVVDLPSLSERLWAADWKKQAGHSVLLDNFVLGADGHTVGMFIWLETLSGPTARRQAVEQIERVVESFSGGGFEPHLAGTPLMNVALDRGSLKASATFLPLAVILALAVLVVMLRSVRLVVAALVAVAVATTWTMGILAMSGRTINMVTAVLPALLFVLVLSNGIHLCTGFAARLGKSGCSRRAAGDSLRELIGPAFLSSVTTAVGFSSLMLSRMQPVRDFGLFAAIGMLVGFAANIAIVPGLLALLCRKVCSIRQASKEHWTGRLGAVMARGGWPVVAMGLVILVLSVAGAARARAESNVLKFFPDDSKIAQDYAFIGERLSGFYTVELDVAGSKGQEKSSLERMGQLASIISARNEVAKVTYLGDFLGLGSSKPILEIGPEDWAETSRLVQGMISRYRYDDGEQVHLRMSVLVRAMASAEFYDLLDYIDRQSGSILGSLAEYEITGVVSLLNDVQQDLIRTQIQSFSTAALVVLTLIGLFFRSFRGMIAALLPNLLPIMIVFAIMGLAKIPLDAATVMIASVAIGIAADDTIHFLWHYRQAARSAGQVEQAVAGALAHAGRAMVCTSVVAAVGFSILCLADFRPIIYFGLLTGATMLTALAGDLLILPASVKVLGLWVKR